MNYLQVWQIRVDVHVMNHDGNIIDCSSIAAITALAHFRSVSILNRHGNIIDCSSIVAIIALAHFRSVYIHY